MSGRGGYEEKGGFCVMDDGRHNLQSEEGRSAVVNINSQNFGRSSCLLTAARGRSAREQPTTANGAGHHRKRKNGFSGV